MAHRFRVLVIEDNPMDARVALQMLGEATLATFTAERADSLTDGMTLLRRTGFDAVLLDLSLHETTGLETFLRLHAEFPQVPVVILTGIASELLAIEAMHQGAQDYLIKWQRVDPNSLARALWYAIERQGRGQLEASLRATNAELQTARKIQQVLFPTQATAHEGFDLAGAWHPAEATCGDYFDFIPMSGRYLGIVLGDVCGHGFGPALVMAETRACLRTLALTHTDVGQIMTFANQLLVDDMVEERFVTLFFARLDLAARTFCYAGAGHRAYLMNSAGEVKSLNSTCMPLGLESGMVVPCAPEAPLALGDMLVAVTDGVEEATSPEGELFGIKRIMSVAREYRHEPAQRIVDRIIHESVVQFTRGAQQDDDFTAVVLKVGSSGPDKHRG